MAKLEEFRQNTAYPHTLYPNYIELRAGMLNFSVLGRDCPYEERLRYQKWDAEHHERLRLYFHRHQSLRLQQSADCRQVAPKLSR